MAALETPKTRFFKNPTEKLARTKKKFIGTNK